MGSLSADVFRTNSCSCYEGMSNTAVVQAHRDGYTFQMHSDERAADVNAAIGGYFFYGNRILEMAEAAVANEPPAFGCGTTFTTSWPAAASCSMIMALFRCSQHCAAR